MVKLIYPLHRKAGMTREEFQRYWREVHAPLVASHADAMRIRRYIQSHTLTTPFDAAYVARQGGTTEPYDGVAELWWDSLEDYMAATATDEGRAAALALLEDERNFIDLGRSPLWLSEEHPVVGE